MDIQSGYYEAGIVLFWLLFAPRKRSSAKGKTHKTH